METIEVKREVVCGLQNKSATNPLPVKLLGQWKIKQKKPLETKKRPLSVTYDNQQHIAPEIKKCASHNRRKTPVNQSYDHLKAEFLVMKRAKDIQANLAPGFPIFMKTMFHSHVSYKFSMTIPSEFRSMHLASHDTIHIIDENGETYTIKLFVAKDGRCLLTTGWKSFSVNHKLLEGDVLIFQLIKPNTFKVYIVRANDSVKTEADLFLLNIITRANQVNIFDYAEEKIVRPLPTDFLEHNSPMVLMNDRADMPETNSDVIDSETSAFLSDFKNVKSIENFTIFVNGSIIDTEVSEYHKIKYFELCCARNSFLHAHLHKTIKGKIAAKMISETVCIADKISACKISTPQSDYSTCDNILEGFEMLGMDVSFMRAKLGRLFSLAFESKEGVDSMRFREASFHQSCARDEIKTLEPKILNLKLLEMKVWDLKHVVKELDVEMHTLKGNADKHEIMFQNEVDNAPWFRNYMATSRPPIRIVYERRRRKTAQPMNH